MPLTCRVTINFEVTVIVTCKYGYENSQPEQYNRWWTWTQLEHKLWWKVPGKCQSA